MANLRHCRKFVKRQCETYGSYTRVDACPSSDHTGHMSEMRDVDEDQVGVPPLTRGWRMQMAMDWGGRSREHMAAVLGVAPSTVSRWLHDQGKRQPRRPDMELWARECRVPIEWLAPNSEDEMVVQPTVPSILPLLSVVDGEGLTTPRIAGLQLVERDL